MHVMSHLQYTGVFELHTIAGAIWSRIDDVMGLVRMPMFALISGYFAVKVLRGSWRNLLLTRSVNFYYIFVLWTIIQTAIFGWLPTSGMPLPYDFAEFTRQLVSEPNNLWFLLALAVYFILAKATLKVRWAAITVSAVLTLVGYAGFLPLQANAIQISVNLTYFLLGAHFPDLARLWTARPRAWAFAIALGAFVLGYVGMKGQLGVGSPEITAAFRMIGALAGIAVVLAIVKWSQNTWAVGTALTFLGKRTLPVYVSHVSLIACAQVLILLIPEALRDAILGNVLVSLIYPPLLTVGIIGVGLAVLRLVRPYQPALLTAPWLTQVTRRRGIVDPQPATAGSAGSATQASLARSPAQQL